MNILIDHRAANQLFDTLVALWKKKEFPFTLSRAVIPQTIIPQSLRGDKKLLANFYFYTCIYMRGGIESIQAFKALLEVYKAEPELFDPVYAGWRSPKDVEAILRKYIGWDSKQAALTWIENSRRLRDFWEGSAINLFKGMTSYDEALRRLRNKRTKKDAVNAGRDGLGFYGFQPKMVSMLVYFWDWEGLFKKRFIYPSPADFHNFRLAIACGVMQFDPQPESIRATEKISAPWREVVMKYLAETKTDPVELADALWLYSLSLCGESPVNMWGSPKKTTKQKEFREISMPHMITSRHEAPKTRKRYLQTCGCCVLQNMCKWSIPAGPYYGRKKGVLTTGMSGHLVILPRPGASVTFKLTPPRLKDVSVQKQLELDALTQNDPGQ